MTIAQFLDAVKSKAYVGKPELARELYKFSYNMISDALQGKSIIGMDTMTFASVLLTYWSKWGYSYDQCVDLLQYASKDWRDNNLRVEYDEEWTEMHYIGY